MNDTLKMYGSIGSAIMIDTLWLPCVSNVNQDGVDYKRSIRDYEHCPNAVTLRMPTSNSSMPK